MNTPIIDAITKYLKEDNTVFHMPGHRQGKLLSFMGDYHPLQFDLTEVEGLDNLHCPTEAIAASMELTSEYYNADKTFYSVNGSTAGIMAMIMGVCSKGDIVVMERGCHRSVYNGVALVGAEVVYVANEYDETLGINLPANTIELTETAIRVGAKAVIITRPTYYGVCLDIKQMCEVLHQYGIAVLVDEAHGAHMKAFNDMPLTAMECGADVCVQSLHKTLPAINQTALIHIKNGLVDENKISKALSMLMTTSPSYILMASIDYAREYMKSFTEHSVNNVKILLNEKCDVLTKETKFKIIKNIQGYQLDWMRLVVNTGDLPISGYELERVLREEYAIQVEMSDNKNIVCILSLYDFEGVASPIGKLVDSLVQINDRILSENSLEKRNELKFDMMATTFPARNIHLSEAMFMESEKICLWDAVGSVSAEYITPYPPGIPLVCPGEIISREIVEYIRYLLSNGAKVNGIIDGEMIWIVR